MSGVPTFFSSSVVRRFSAPDRPAPVPSAFERDAFVAMFHDFLKHSGARDNPAEAAQALSECFDARSGTLDLTRLPSKFADLPYKMIPQMWTLLSMTYDIATLCLPQAKSAEDMNQAFEHLNQLRRLRHVIVLIPSDGQLPSFRAIKLHTQAHEPVKITLRGTSDAPMSGLRSRILTQRRASLPLLKPSGKHHAPATPTRPAARPSAPASIEPPTRHLLMPAPMTVSGAPGTQLTVPPKRLSLDVPSTR